MKAGCIILAASEKVQIRFKKGGRDLTTEQTLQGYLNQLLDAYSHHYNVERDVTVEGVSYPAAATFFLRDENYFFSKKKVMSAFEQYDYTYFYLTDHLDAAAAQEQLDLALKVGMSRVKPHKEHKSSYVTLVILANTIDPEAKKLIKKTRFTKNFRLALHGWMEYHIAAMETSTNSFLSNPAGKGVKKTLEQNFGFKVK